MTVKQQKQLVFNKRFLQTSGIKRDNDLFLKTTTNPVNTQEGLLDILLSKNIFYLNFKNYHEINTRAI